MTFMWCVLLVFPVGLTGSHGTSSRDARADRAGPSLAYRKHRGAYGHRFGESAVATLTGEGPAPCSYAAPARSPTASRGSPTAVSPPRVGPPSNSRCTPSAAARPARLAP